MSTSILINNREFRTDLGSITGSQVCQLGGYSPRCKVDYRLRHAPNAVRMRDYAIPVQPGLAFTVGLPVRHAALREARKPPPAPYHTKRFGRQAFPDRRTMQAFLKVLKAAGAMKAACREYGVSKMTVNALRCHDKWFDDRCWAILSKARRNWRPPVRLYKGEAQ